MWFKFFELKRQILATQINYTFKYKFDLLEEDIVLKLYLTFFLSVFPLMRSSPEKIDNEQIFQELHVCNPKKDALRKVNTLNNK